MAVEILILSGVRQGERLELGDSEFWLGDAREHQVRFDSLKDPGAKGRSILIRLEQDGWHIRNEGAGPIWVNQHRLQTSSPIRSSDVIRLSESGPDVSFIIHARKSAPLASQVPAPMPAPPTQPAIIVNRPTVASQAVLTRSASRSQAPWLLIAPIGVISLVLVAFYSGLFRSPVNPGAPKSPPTTNLSPTPDDELKARKLETKSGGGQVPAMESTPTGLNSDAAGANRIKPSTEPDPWPAVADANRRAVYALAIESPGGLMWSFGTCFAIRHDTVVTTASLATEFERLKTQESGWRMWVYSPEQELRQEVKERRVHAGYVQAVTAKKPPQFFDVALLTVDGDLPQTCSVASRAELDGIDRQTRVACLGIVQPIPEEGEAPEPIGRFDLLAPELVAGRLLDVGKFSDGPDAPRLLFLANTFPATLWGSPIFDETGKVIAVFTLVERNDRDNNVAILVAPMLGSVGDWLRNAEPQLWVAPKVPQAARASEKTR